MRLVESKNFKGYLKTISTPREVRHSLLDDPPEIEFAVNGDDWEIRRNSSFVHHVSKFKLDKKFDEKSLERIEVSGVYILVEDQLVLTEVARAKGVRASRITRFIKDGKLFTVYVCGDGKATLIYEKA